MTENKAKEVVKKLRNKAELFKNRGFAVDGIVKSFEDSANAIETLSEEIQQYRAIGTVEGYEKAIQTTTEYYLLMKEYKSKVQDFEAIGTIEEFKALKDINRIADNLSKMERIEYKVLKERNEPKLMYYEYGVICQTCGKDVSDWEINYCPVCGQRVR